MTAPKATTDTKITGSAQPIKATSKPRTSMPTESKASRPTPKPMPSAANAGQESTTTPAERSAASKALDPQTVPAASTATSKTATATGAATVEPSVPTARKKPATKARTAKAPATKTATSIAAATPRSANTKTATKTSMPAKPATAKAPATKTVTKAAATSTTGQAANTAPVRTGAPDVTIGTDAAFAGKAPAETRLQTVHNISEVRHFFRTNDVPIFFIGATPFNLLGLDRWVRNFTYVSYYDAWDGGHPRVFTPSFKPYREFGSGEEINNWLLLNAEVRTRMTKDLRPGVRPKVAMVFFNEETEHICEELGYDLILPPAALRTRLDSKIVTTKLGNEAGAPSVPNVLSKGTNWKALRKVADKAALGDELVVQTPYGDSGKTTFFINNEEDWNRHSQDIIGEEIKVMRRINNLPVAVEAVLTTSGTVVGPFLTELAGHEELTPYRGGWCGNEMHPEVLNEKRRAKATELVKRLGDRLALEGYRGFFEIDVLVDTDTDEVYLGELNPRISGASAITNVTAGAYADVPLFLFHLLEYMDVEYELDVDEINERWQALSGADVWSQMIIKETSDTLELLTATPATGQYYLDATGALVFNRAALDWHMLQNENEAFFLRVYGPGDYRWKGGDLGILVTKGRLQVERNGASKLSIRAKHFIDSVRAGFRGIPLSAEVQLEAGFESGVELQ